MTSTTVNARQALLIIGKGRVDTGPLQVTGDLDFGGDDLLQALPTGLQVRGSLRLRNCRGLKELRPGLVVGRDMDLSFTGVKSLPPDLRVGRDLLLSGSEVRQLPLGLAPRGLDLSDTPIKALPDDLTEMEWLNVSRCSSLVALPAGLRVRRHAFLRECTALRLLPDGLEVGGTLELVECTRLKVLPERMKVGGNLDLRKSGVPPEMALSAGVKVGGWIKR